MTTDTVNDRISIKNILFTKAMPNYKIPIPTDGHKLFSCIDCSDKFIFESSYKVHINRKSLQITYFCRYCGKLNVFYNRCQFLAHIRSHAVKTATINLSDLKIEPLLFISSDNIAATTSKSVPAANPVQTSPNLYCFECKKDITATGIIEQDRVKHYMQHTTRVFTCPVCLFALPSSCALNAHIRVHLKSPPYICPECGTHLSNSACIYPYNHDCEGFKMMRVTSRIKCFKDNCQLLHPNNFMSHMKLYHLNKIFKCPSCYLAGYNENAVMKHVMQCCDKVKYPTYYECQQCPGVFLSVNQINKHLDMHLPSIHKNIQVYPCWNCGVICNDVRDLLNHHTGNHCASKNLKPLAKILNKLILSTCSNCSKISYQCGDNLNVGPYKCPHCPLQIPTELPLTSNQSKKEIQIVCHLCQVKVNENWEEIKAHFKHFHNHIKCLDLKINLTKINLKEIEKKNNSQKRLKLNKICKRNNKKAIKTKLNINKNNTATPVYVERNNTSNFCKKCHYHTEDAKSFQLHILSHRDPSLAYQCMECGQCFAVKPSFSTHLLIDHAITDVNYYVDKNNCFNKDALEKYHVKSDTTEEKPLEANQCNICRDKFPDPNSLGKHYRIHGMAFLKKNTQMAKSP